MESGTNSAKGIFMGHAVEPCAQSGVTTTKVRLECSGVHPAQDLSRGGDRDTPRHQHRGPGPGSGSDPGPGPTRPPPPVTCRSRRRPAFKRRPRPGGRSGGGAGLGGGGAEPSPAGPGRAGRWRAAMVSLRERGPPPGAAGDLAALSELDEAALLAGLRERFLQQHIYVSAGGRGGGRRRRALG